VICGMVFFMVVLLRDISGWGVPLLELSEKRLIGGECALFRFFLLCALLHPFDALLDAILELFRGLRALQNFVQFTLRFFCFCPVFHGVRMVG